MLGRIKYSVSSFFHRIKVTLQTDKRTKICALIILVFSVSGLIFLLRTDPTSLFSPKHYFGSKECISYVEKLEGATLKGVHTLHCTLEPRTIGNSSLYAKFFAYHGEPTEYPEHCADVDQGFFGPAAKNYYKYCISYAGVITSDGNFYRELGYHEPSTYAGTDYCYSISYKQFVHDNPTNARDRNRPGVAPTIRDLYFYQGQLYDRDVYQHASFQTQFGTCTLNGTTLTNYSGRACDVETVKKAQCYSDGGIISNVTVDYTGFPTTCQSAAIGHTAQEAEFCINLVTAANATLHDCETKWDMVLGPEDKTKFPTNTDEYRIVLGFKPGQNPISRDCVDTYIKRMANLNRCEEIVNESQRGTCKSIRNNTSGNIRQVTTQL